MIKQGILIFTSPVETKCSIREKLPEQVRLPFHLLPENLALSEHVLFSLDVGDHLLQVNDLFSGSATFGVRNSQNVPKRTFFSPKQLCWSATRRSWAALDGFTTSSLKASSQRSTWEIRRKSKREINREAHQVSDIVLVSSKDELRQKSLFRESLGVHELKQLLHGLCLDVPDLHLLLPCLLHVTLKHAFKHVRAKRYHNLTNIQWQNSDKLTCWQELLCGKGRSAPHTRW